MARRTRPATISPRPRAGSGVEEEHRRGPDGPRGTPWRGQAEAAPSLRPLHHHPPPVSARSFRRSQKQNRGAILVCFARRCAPNMLKEIKKLNPLFKDEV